jgi:hypothetical protein
MQNLLYLKLLYILLANETAQSLCLESTIDSVNDLNIIYVPYVN